ncbi:MAG: hypothetical protein IBJ09_02600 [Bacteroidia bacterium]|nr:hypothetical protein [Bacteroidia bacterium]
MKKLIIILLSSALAGGASAQKIKLTSGSLAFLASVQSVNVSFDYSNMKVGKMSESEYVKTKSEEYNKKESGRGDQWKQSWTSDREERFEPKFLELLAKNAPKWSFSKGSEGPVEMKVHTTFTEPGFNVVVAKQYAMVDLTITFIQNGSEAAVVTVGKAPGRTYGYGDLDTGVRITEAYAAAGKYLGKFLVKSVK